MIVLDFGKRQISQLPQDRNRIGALQSDLTILGACVSQLDVLILVMRTDPVPIFLSRAGIYDQQQMIFSEAIDKQIIDHGSFRRCQGRILRLAVD